jgi:hypothetical protein
MRFEGGVVERVLIQIMLWKVMEVEEQARLALILTRHFGYRFRNLTDQIFIYPSPLRDLLLV